MKKILIPIDGSDNSKRALMEGKKLAELLESEVHLLYVGMDEKIQEAHADVTTLDLRSDDEAIGKQIISDGLEVFTDYNGPVKGNIEVGNPAEVIIQVAEKEKVDLVVIGSRGLTGASRFVLGSVSNKVLNHVQTSVLTIR